MIKAIAIDDEPLALKVIEFYCDTIECVTLEKTFCNLDNARKHLNKYPVDVIFLDIEMPKLNGLDFYKSLNQNIKVIFTTAYNQYAVEGFNVNAIDYLLKPFSLERFMESVSRLDKKETPTSNNNQFLTIRADYKLNRIPFEDILYIEAMSDYVKIHIEKDKTIVARSTMKNIIEKISDQIFIRIHRSYIVPKKNIKNISTNEISLGYVQLPIGNSYRKKLENLI